MPPAPKSPSSSAKKAGGAPKAKGAVRAKSGCYTCRIRRKKCDEQPNPQGQCQTCVRLRLECLGFGAKRPEWLRESRNVLELREKIKTFLASQGMIKGHSGSGPRNAEHEPQILRLHEEGYVQQTTPPTPLLSLSGEPSRPLLPPFNNLSAVRDTQWALQPHPPLPYPPVHPPHELRPNTPGSQFYPSPDSHPAVLPQPYTSPSMSSSSTSLAPLYSMSSMHYASARPWEYSSFGRSYHLPHTENEESYEEQQLDPALYDVTNSQGLGVVSYRDGPQLNLNPDPFNDALVNHYMRAVVNIQYLLANKSDTAEMIFRTIQDNQMARNAVRLLASVHQHRRRTRREDRALESFTDEARGIYDELAETLLPGALILRQRSYSREDAMAALLVISSVLFDGGVGDWQSWLTISYQYVDAVFAGYDNPADALMYLAGDQKMSFIIKTTLWFDVIASVTTQQHPHYLSVIDQVFSPRQANIDGVVPVSMLDVMGCDNNTFWAMAQTSALSCWKQARIGRGSLSVPELVLRGGEIEQALTHTYHPTTDGAEGEDLCRLHTAAIFRASTLAWLHSIISGDRPHVPEVAKAVQDTLKCLRNIPSDDERIERSIVRSTVFSIFICGVFTSKRQDRKFLVDHLQKQSSDNVGNCTAITNLMQQIWIKYDSDGKSSTVKWREPLRESHILLV